MKEKIFVGLMFAILISTSMAFVGFQGVAISSDSEPSAGTALSEVDWWPMFRHDARGTGYSTSEAPNTNTTLWTSQIISAGTPVVADGKVYVTGKRLLPINEWMYSVWGYIYALNASNGQHIWNGSIGKSVSLSESPAVADGKVYVGSSNALTRDGKIHCLDATTGAPIWNYTTYDSVYCSPAVANGVVFVGSYDGFCYALNASTGDYVWSYPVGRVLDSCPAIYDDRVFIPGHTPEGNGVLYCLNATNGSYIWSWSDGFFIASSPAVAYGMVFIGTDINFYALDIETGELEWIPTYRIAEAFSSAAFYPAERIVYMRSSWQYDNKLYAYDIVDGSFLWEYFLGPVPTPGYRSWSSPTVAGGKVFIGSCDGTGGGMLYAINASTGSLIWRYQTDSNIHSSPAVADGTVFVGSDDGKVYAFAQRVHNIAIYSNLGLYKTVVGQGYTMRIQVIAENLGDFPESSVNITAYANTTIIETTCVAIEFLDFKELTFIWNTSGFEKGPYAIWAHATPVPNETKTTDNTIVYGIVNVAYPGDITGPYGVPDGIVDMRDIGLVAQGVGANQQLNPRSNLYAKYVHSPLCGRCPHDPNADINDDAKIDMRDAGIASRNFGYQDP